MKNSYVCNTEETISSNSEAFTSELLEHASWLLVVVSGSQTNDCLEVVAIVLVSQGLMTVMTLS